MLTPRIEKYNLLRKRIEYSENKCCDFAQM